MTHRRFVCTTQDLNRFEQIMNDAAANIWGKEKRRIPTSLEQACHYAESYVNRLAKHHVSMDEYTQEAYDIFVNHCTFLNLHMFIHHAIWQLLQSYDAGNPSLVGFKNAERRERAKNARSWRRITADCQVE